MEGIQLSLCLIPLLIYSIQFFNNIFERVGSLFFKLLLSMFFVKIVIKITIHHIFNFLYNSITPLNIIILLYFILFNYKFILYYTYLFLNSSHKKIYITLKILKLSFFNYKTGETPTIFIIIIESSTDHSIII